MKSNIYISFILLLSVWLSCDAKTKPNSNFNGVQIGAITYSYRWMPEATIPAIVEQAIASGVSSIELMGFPVEEYAGIPGGTTLKPYKKKNNPISKAEYEKLAEKQRAWRASVSMDKFKEIRNMFDKAGVKVDILKLGFPEFWTDEEFDYAFKVAKTLGACGLTMEISETAANRMAPLAERNGMYVIFHNHLQPQDPTFSFDKILSYGNKLMLNFDIGHYVKATGKNPTDIIKKYHDRIASIHLKDRVGPENPAGEPDLPFGQGETPLKEVLVTIQENGWMFPCHIEIEYKPEKGSDSIKEVSKAVDYCRQILEKKSR